MDKTTLDPQDDEYKLAATDRLDDEKSGVKRVIGTYRVERVLGQGGMGKVYLGMDESLERRVAIKVIGENLSISEEAQKRLNTEARAAARLNHSNIVQVYAFGKEEKSGLTYIAFEFVDGRDLDNIIKKEGPIPCERALGLIRQAALGLRFAFSQNIIHRDIKPANLMVTKDETLKIADFGLAKELDKDHMKTSMNAIIGSPAFMSPEQGSGRTLDFRSDIYSLGATLFCALTARIPFKGESAVSVILMHATEPLPEPPEISQLMDGRVMALIRKMMAKKPEDRHQSYDELIAEIDALLSPTRGAASAAAVVPKGRSKGRALVALGIGGLILSVGAVAMILGSGRGRAKAIPPSEPNLSSKYAQEVVSAETSAASTQTPLPVQPTPAPTAPPRAEPVQNPAPANRSLNSLTVEELQKVRAISGLLRDIATNVYPDISSRLPITLFPNDPARTVTITMMGPQGSQAIYNGETTQGPAPHLLPNDYKAELARIYGEFTPQLTPLKRAQLDFFRYMHGDPTVPMERVLENLPGNEDRQQYLDWMKFRDVWSSIVAQELNNLAQPNNGQPRNNPRPGGDRPVRNLIRDRIANP
ncbi:MAG: serine/threonine-protein kinase [Candidatus Sumerlaeia bacterium]|nr:serine/threonine-protein kinase [Candidatus Sumerlaeia bacterium]